MLVGEVAQDGVVVVLHHSAVATGRAELRGARVDV